MTEPRIISLSQLLKDGFKGATPRTFTGFRNAQSRRRNDCTYRHPPPPPAAAAAVKGMPPQMDPREEDKGLHRGGPEEGTGRGRLALRKLPGPKKVHERNLFEWVPLIVSLYRIK